MRVVGLVLVVGSGGVRVGWSGTALTWGEDEFRRGVAIVFHEEHVAACAIQELGENLTWRGRTVFPEDALVHNASCDLDAGVMGDLTEDLVEAGVVGRDREAAVGQGDLSALWLLLGGCERDRGLRGGGSWRQGGYGLNGCGGFGLSSGGRLRRQQGGGREARIEDEANWPNALHVVVGRAAAKKRHRREEL